MSDRERFFLPRWQQIDYIHCLKQKIKKIMKDNEMSIAIAGREKLQNCKK